MICQKPTALVTTSMPRTICAPTSPIVASDATSARRLPACAARRATTTAQITVSSATATPKNRWVMFARAAQQQVLRRVLAGELPLAIQAKATQDVRTAIYLKEEFKIPRLILDYAIEAWREPELLKRSGVAVVLPPFPPGGRYADGFVNDSYFQPLDAAKTLHDLGVPFALSGHDARTVGARLSDQAGLAQRGGLSFDDALAAVTLVPARLVGVEKRVGSLEVGKDADLVLWSGKPFEPTSRVIGVLLEGELVLDPRPR